MLSGLLQPDRLGSSSKPGWNSTTTSPASGFEHASTGARDSIRKWYIKRGLYTVAIALGIKLPRCWRVKFR